MGWSRRLIVLITIAAVICALWQYLTRRSDRAATAGG
jgi:hypothetical protein